MRAAIRQQLINQIPDIESRCYEPHAAGAKTLKPYLVLRQGIDSENTLWTGFRRIIEVWPYLSRTTFQDVDSLVQKIVTALVNQPLTTAVGEVFTCQYLGVVGPDFVDEEWDAITRGLRFAVMALQPVVVSETVANDPWLEALALWTTATLGAAWTIYRNVWPLGYMRPSMMWRISGVEVQEKGRAMFVVRKKFFGHVLGSTPNEQAAGILTVLQELGNAVKLPLDAPGNRYLIVQSPSADYRADAMAAGQLSVTLFRSTSRPTEEIPYIMQVYGRGSLS